MKKKKKYAQISVASSAQKESYSKIEIRKGENDGIYHSYGTTEETLRQAGAAILQFSDLGFNVEKITDNCWKATHNNYEPVWIEVESFEWYGLQNEIDGMCECIRDNYKEIVKLKYKVR